MSRVHTGSTGSLMNQALGRIYTKIKLSSKWNWTVLNLDHIKSKLNLNWIFSNGFSRILNIFYILSFTKCVWNFTKISVPYLPPHLQVFKIKSVLKKRKSKKKESILCHIAGQQHDQSNIQALALAWSEQYSFSSKKSLNSIVYRKYRKMP